ncbi:MAG: agmatinase [Candidatus Omnitrophica bacterium]|nr:agmatinase [Candidatus Omnitrophota bacterium]
MTIFGSSDNKLGSFKNAKAVILPVPYGKTVTYRKGTEKGPRTILDASDKLELFDEELNREIHRIGINTAPSLKIASLKPEKAVNLVKNKVSDIFKKGKLPVVLGGEHSITIGAVQAAKKYYKDLSVLYFDAHCDLRNTYKGSKYNHACVARRVSEIAPLVEVGTRSLSKEEFDFLKHDSIKVISMLDIMRMPGWPEVVKKKLSKNVYISIDLDVFDPSIMPAIGTPEPGGMGWHDFLKAIRNIISSKNIVGFDITELCPIKDMAGPDFAAAKLIYKLLGYIFF